MPNSGVALSRVSSSVGSKPVVARSAAIAALAATVDSSSRQAATQHVQPPVGQRLLHEEVELEPRLLAEQLVGVENGAQQLLAPGLGQLETVDAVDAHGETVELQQSLKSTVSGSSPRHS
jgi:hypothetical protein